MLSFVAFVCSRKPSFMPSNAAKIRAWSSLSNWPEVRPTPNIALNSFRPCLNDATFSSGVSPRLVALFVSASHFETAFTDLMYLCDARIRFNSTFISSSRCAFSMREDSTKAGFIVCLLARNRLYTAANTGAVSGVCGTEETNSSSAAIMCPTRFARANPTSTPLYL